MLLLLIGTSGEAQFAQPRQGRFVGGVALAEIAALDARAGGESAVFHVGENPGHARIKEPRFFAFAGFEVVALRFVALAGHRSFLVFKC